MQDYDAMLAGLAARFEATTDPAAKARIADDYRAIKAQMQQAQPMPETSYQPTVTQDSPQVTLAPTERQLQDLASDFQAETDPRAKAAIANAYRQAKNAWLREQARIEDQRAGINTKQSPLSIMERAQFGASGDDTNEQLRMLRDRGYRAQLDRFGNVLVLDPESGQWARADEAGMGWGDLFDLASPAIRGVGGAIGGTLGALAGPVMAVGGSGAGEMVGGILADQLLRPAQQATFEQRAMTAGGDFASGALPEGVGRLLARGWSALAPGAIPSGRALTEAAETAEAYARQGVTPANVASINPSFANRAGVAVAESMPFVGGPRVQERMAQTGEQFGEAVRRAAPGGSPYETGRAIREGLMSERDRLAEEQGQVFSELGQLLGPERRPMPATAQRLAETEGITQPIERATRVNPVLERLRPDEGEPLEASFETIKQQRSQIGEMIRNPQLAPSGTDQRRLKEAYRTLTQDMERIVDDAGLGDEWRAANARYKEYAQRLKEIDKNFKPETSAPEELAARVAGLARTAPSKLEQLKKSVTNDDWQQLASYVLRDLAQGTPGRVDEAGDISMSTFLTGINKLGRGADADRAKTILFGDRGAAMRENLEDLARISSSNRQMESLLNSSGTARALSGPLLGAALGTTAGGATGGVGAMVLGAGVPVGLSYLLTRKGFSGAVREAARRANGEANIFERELNRLLPRVAGQVGGSVALDAFRPDR